ncbi:MAG TPA: type II secretion system protein [Chthoniobacter sp.]|jgi:type II secretory pathway pseudopilin PulG
MKKSNQSAFTLVELMLIVAILADLAVVAMPAFIRSRDQAQNTKFIVDLRTASGSFEMYSAENNGYPPAATAGVVPSGMGIYLGNFPWSSGNSIGGSWQWAPGYQNTTAALQVSFGSDPGDLRMADIDSRMDDGNLATGAFRQGDSTDYYYIVEP